MTTLIQPENDRLEIFKRSPFWRISSVHVLAKALKIPYEDLSSICNRGRSNYSIHPNAKGRLIEAPNADLKKLQRRVHKLLARIEPPAFLYSGVKKRCAVSNAARHVAGVPFVKMDLRRFYPSCDGRLVFRFFRDVHQCSERVATMLWKLCTISKLGQDWRTHLPTGGASSPILAYYCYMEMFGGLHALATQHDLRFTVLADDMTFSGPSASSAVLRSAEAIVHCAGLVSHLQKRKVYPKGYHKLIVTGVHITPKGPRVPMKQKGKIRDLWNLLTADPKAAHPIAKDRAKIYQKLCGSLSSAAQIEPKFRKTSAAKLVEWRKDRDAWQAHLSQSGVRKAGKKWKPKVKKKTTA
jgi:hypothetical protein